MQAQQASGRMRLHVLQLKQAPRSRRVRTHQRIELQIVQHSTPEKSRLAENWFRFQLSIPGGSHVLLVCAVS